jgi:ribosomal protein S18 acetylase RimI-like enzyme
MIYYTDSCSAISPENINGFFEGWPNRPSPETHMELLKRSDYLVLAIDDENNGVVGFITAISDGILSAYIPFLEVLPPYRRKGIGTELVRRMLHKLNSLYMIDLVCDPNMQPFYEGFGMDRASAMILRNYNRQSGSRVS